MYAKLKLPKVNHIICVSQKNVCVFTGGELIQEPLVFFRAWIHTCADSPSVSGHSPGLETQSLSVLSTRCDILSTSERLDSSDILKVKHSTLQLFPYQI